MKTVAIVQARLDSSRLPGKALERIGERTILEWVIRRVRMIQPVDQIVLATSARKSDVPIVKEGLRLGVDVFQGAANDVLDRFLKCADTHKATHILRVTADCPLLDPYLNERIIRALHDTYADYVGMTTRTVGFVQEAFTIQALERAWVNGYRRSDREHVVPWMLRELKTLFLRTETDLGSGRYCVDTARDLLRLQAMYQREPGLFGMDAASIIYEGERCFAKPA